MDVDRLMEQASEAELAEVSRLVALCDGVFAIIITLLVLDLRVPRVDARLLIATGLGTTGLSLYLMTGFTPDVSQGTLIRTGLMQGFGIGFVFVPLGTVAFRTLAPALSHEYER